MTLTASQLATVQAGHFPADALAGVLDGWSGECEAHIGPDTGWIPAAILRGRPVFALHQGLPLRLPLARPEVRHRLAVVFGEGVRCPECDGAGRLSGCPVAEALCGMCAPDSTRPAMRSGYLLPPSPLWHLLPRRESPTGHTLGDEAAVVLVGAHVAGVLAGGRGVVGVLGEWAGQWRPGVGLRQCSTNEDTYPHRDENGWTLVVAGLEVAHGPETGPAGMAAADATALAAGFALVDPTAPGGVRVRWPEVSE